jgi:leucyl aminopeptidase
MDYGIATARKEGSRPLWLVTEQTVEAWRSGLEASAGSWVGAAGFRGEAQRLLLLPGADGELAGAALGLGPASALTELSPWTLAALPDKLPQGPWHLAQTLPSPAATRALLGWALGRYRFDRYRSGSRAAPAMTTLEAPAGADLEHVRRAAQADALARDLINTPAGDMGPEQLAAAAGRLAATHAAHCEQVVGDALLEAGLHMIHAVGRAGPQSPRLIDLRWGDASHPKVTLVGKGVCFDSGGLDLKNAQGMLLMKKDMGGAACALGLAAMVMDGGLPIRLRVLVPAVENSVDAVAYRPGDVLRTRKGLTVEVGNTDAEGRLVLADALALAGEETPELLIDLATLTGAARVALGPDLPALYANDDSLARDIEAAAADEADPLWRMPLWPPYDEDLASKVADLSNVATHAFAGSILGALFLQRFVGPGTRWAHLDLYAWSSRDRPGRPVGGQAQCIRALYCLLQRRYPLTPRR